MSETSKKIMIGWEAVPYLLLLVTLFIVPRDVSILRELSVASVTATSWTAIFVLVIFGSSIGLTFDGFMRFSRYRMSRDHRVLNMVLSFFGAFMPFFALLIGPLATILSYLILAYSYYISPRNPATVRERRFYQRKYFAYLVNAGLLSVMLTLILSVS